MKTLRVGPVFGAEVVDVDLSRPTSADIETIEGALVDHEVLIFRDQPITAEEQLIFGRSFGQLVISPFSPNADSAPELIILDYNQKSSAPLTDIWHADETYRPAPPKFTILKAVRVPELGGDTMFASMRAAYEGLSDRMRTHLAGLTAHHGFGRFDRLIGNTPEGRKRVHAVEELFPHPDHPVVSVHPDSGRRVLYVNRHFTETINELPDDEGRAILQFLLEQTARPEHQLRVSWQPGTIVMWDNRSVQHYAPYDYWPQRRRMERVTIAGTAPLGDGASDEVTTRRLAVDGVFVDPADDYVQAARQFERQKAQAP
jgi:taurine dioxygenase